MQKGKKQDKKIDQDQKAIIIGPASELTENLAKFVSSAVSVVTTGGTKIGHITGTKKANHENKDSVVYKIPCGGCHKSYYGETGRGLETRLKEHKADLRYHRMSNALVIHAEKESHLPNWSSAAVVCSNLTKTERRALEATFISTEPTTNTSIGFFKTAAPVARLIQRKMSSSKKPG